MQQKLYRKTQWLLVLIVSIITLTGLAFSAKAGVPCGTVGSPEGTCEQICGGTIITDQMSVCRASANEVCCKGIPSPGGGGGTTGVPAPGGGGGTIGTPPTPGGGGSPYASCQECRYTCNASEGYQDDPAGDEICQESGKVCCKKIPSPGGGGGTITPPTPGGGGGVIPGYNCTDNTGFYCIKATSTCKGTDEINNSLYCPAIGSENAVCCAPKGQGTTGSGAGTGTGTGTPNLNGIEIPSGTGLPDPGGSNPVHTVVVNFLKWLITLFLVLAVIAFVITGIQFLVAMGSSYSSAATNAKNNFQYALLALVIVGSSYIIMLTIDTLLSAR